MLQENLSARRGPTARTAPQHPMGASKLELWDVIPTISYAQPFIHVKIVSSKNHEIRNNSKYWQGQQTCNLKKKKEEKNFIYVVKEFNYKQTLKFSKQKGN